MDRFQGVVYAALKSFKDWLSRGVKFKLRIRKAIASNRKKTNYNKFSLSSINIVAILLSEALSTSYNLDEVIL